ncbi:MAG: PLP-dependent aminotransferase family protein [Oscillospiraceae bacterium]|nr:PLP-dependent aminotransferase family protein [Oscillospiraceae bacterium]
MQYTFSKKVSGAGGGSAVEEILRYAGDPTVISLAGGNPASETFPARELADIAAELLREQPELALQYNTPRGYAPFRAQVADRLKTRSGIGRDFDDLFIVTGGQQAIDLAAKVLCDEGDTVLVENPSFIGALNAFRAFGAQLTGVPMEEDGVDVAAIEKALEACPNARLFYTIPSFHNPTGITTSLEKRKAVYDLCVRHNVVILEDDPYGELTFDGAKVPTYKSMDTEGAVIYVNSFSKILSPGLRVGYTIAHRDIIANMVDSKQNADVHTPILNQLMTYEYLKRYDIDANILEMRRLYARKCQVILDAIERCLPAAITHTTPRGGLFVWCDMGGGYDTREVAKQCAAQKVVFVPGSTFMVDMDAPCPAFRLNYSTMPDDRIVQGVELLGRALHGIMG